MREMKNIMNILSSNRRIKYLREKVRVSRGAFELGELFNLLLEFLNLGLEFLDASITLTELSLELLFLRLELVVLLNLG